MGKYIEMIRIRFLMMLAYRTNYYSGILIYTINIGAYYFLWQAIYSGKENIESLSISQMTTYIAIAWMARAFYFNNIDREIAMEIQEGRVAVELIRPYNYLGMKVMQGLGEGIFRFAFFSIPGMIIVTLLFSLQITTNFQTWLYFFLSLVFSFIINTQINLMTGMLTFSYLIIVELCMQNVWLLIYFQVYYYPLAFILYGHKKRWCFCHFKQSVIFRV